MGLSIPSQEEFGARPTGHPQELSLNGILRRMSKFIQSVAGDQVAVTTRLGLSVGKVYADPMHTEELIMQLVLHAAKAMPEGGQLTLETTVSGDHASLSVTHTGGLQESAALDLAFQRYWTSDSNRLEAFFPRWTEPEPAAGEPPSCACRINFAEPCGCTNA
jgi:signal transduction histidine kinase